MKEIDMVWIDLPSLHPQINKLVCILLHSNSKQIIQPKVETCNLTSFTNSILIKIDCSFVITSLVFLNGRSEVCGLEMRKKLDVW